jgi:hypothetical protein
MDLQKPDTDSLKTVGVVAAPIFDCEKALIEAVNAMKETIEDLDGYGCQPLIDWLEQYAHKEFRKLNQS